MMAHYTWVSSRSEPIDGTSNRPGINYFRKERPLPIHKLNVHRLVPCPTRHIHLRKISYCGGFGDNIRVGSHSAR